MSGGAAGPGPGALAIAALFASVSLAAFGGANVVVPDLRHAIVDAHGWLPDAEFLRVFAVTQAAPGPNVMIAGLLGFRLAGWLGALIATVAMCGPSALLVLIARRAHDRWAGSPWVRAFGAGLAPITVGLVLATGVTLARAASPAAMGALGPIVAIGAAIAASAKKSGLAVLAAGAIAGVVFGM